MSPSGIKTWLPSDVYKQEFVTDKLIELYKSTNYQPIVIPTLVDMSVLEQANIKFSDQVFKLFDKDGNTLALRTELTQPIAKAIASRAEELSFPQRLYYNSSIFRYSGIATDDSREIQQIGIEHIGGDASSDLETLELFLKSIDTLGIQNYQVTITHTIIWEKIFDKYDEIAGLIYALALDGNLIDLQEIFDQECSELKVLLNGNLDDVGQVLELDLSPLQELLQLNPCLKFDPLQCPDINLYTGLHFNLIVPNQGKLVAMGGRYDNLCANFGTDLPAIGFAFYLPRLIAVMDEQDLFSDTSSSEPKPSRVLRIAVSKGTLLEGALSFLKSKGIDTDYNPNERKLILKAESQLDFDEIEILLVRGHDVPIYVDHGAVDLGIVGIDTVVDSETNVVKLKNLDYGNCKLCVCAKQGLYSSVANLPSYTRVATTFPNLSKEFFDMRGLDVEIIDLYGSVELGPLTDLSDVIVDLVATGKTLKENGLEIIEEIMDCSAVLIANQVSLKLYKDEFLQLIA